MIEQLNHALDELTREIVKRTPEAQKHPFSQDAWVKNELSAARAMLRAVIEKVERAIENQV